MGLFGKKKKEANQAKNPNSGNANTAQLPKLPELPNIQQNPNQNTQNLSRTQTSVQKPNQLPSIPSNSLGNKFSQDSIKEAVSGKRGEETFYADDFSEEQERMPGSLRKPMMRELDEEIEAEELGVPTPSRRRTTSRGIQRQRTSIESEPIFIRIDNFEEAMQTFDETTKKLSEIEGLLEKIKEVRDKEEKELQSWEKNIKKLENEIGKIDKDIFSKV